MHGEVAAMEWSRVEAEWLIVALPQDADLPPRAAALDRTLGGTLARLKDAGDLAGKLGEVVVLHDVPQIAARRELLVGLGKPDTLTRAGLTKAIQTAARKISEKRTARVAGNSVRLDLNFLEAHLPGLYGHVLYRMLDVTSWAGPAQWWRGVPPMTKELAHTATGDIRESIAEMRYLREALGLAAAAH